MALDHEPERFTPSALQVPLQTLAVLERLYHAAYPAASLEDFDRLVAPDFWEIGASGRHYSRAFARQALATRPETPEATHWQDRDHVLSPLGPDLFMLTYTLEQPGRRTRRMSLWRAIDAQWLVIFHQGTVVV